ncbi:hypothetical protein ACJ73_02830 [Blastomyces percursus]|uniref:Uncharacterized protein n=1 Tax=Blastomyces percursus TaxID=1658174 RepID=A0A1J9RCT3_9EURO|nr:hypothetical protein ACJ73_02830 [Blastomyces percursus]
MFGRLGWKKALNGRTQRAGPLAFAMNNRLVLTGELERRSRSAISQLVRALKGLVDRGNLWDHLQSLVAEISDPAVDQLRTVMFTSPKRREKLASHPLSKRQLVETLRNSKLEVRSAVSYLSYSSVGVPRPTKNEAAASRLLLTSAFNNTQTAHYGPGYDDDDKALSKPLWQQRDEIARDRLRCLVLGP